MNTRRLTTRFTMLAAVAALGVVALYGALAPKPTQASHPPTDCIVGDYVATWYHLQLVEGSTRADADEIAATNGGAVVYPLTTHPLRPGFVVQFPCPHEDPELRPEAMQALITAVESDPRVDHFIPSSLSHHEHRHHEPDVVWGR